MKVAAADVQQHKYSNQFGRELPRSINRSSITLLFLTYLNFHWGKAKLNPYFLI